MAHRPARTLAEVLDDALRRTPLTPVDVESPATADGEVVEQVRSTLEDAAGAAVPTGRWSAGDPLRLAKGTVSWLLRCPQRALVHDDGGASDDLVAGLAVDAAAKLATLVPHRPPTAETALAYLAATGDTTAADHLADLGDRAARLVDDIAARIDLLAATWPTIEPDWWPRVEEPVRVRLGDGAVQLAGRLDLLLGGPPSARPPVVVEVKGGRWYDGMRADGHFYALLAALRDGVPPRAVVTVVADGTTQVEPVRPAVLVTAAERVAEAMQVAAAIAAGEPPAVHPGSHCVHCPLRSDCAAGRTWRADDPLAG
ncbi:MAG: hypothetical protein JXA83_05690 [Acidimicrobiales bacterium]|nr:hypothetical protein [Acidimicrobiales bacterium]